jgi:hypothetical protein
MLYFVISVFNNSLVWLRGIFTLPEDLERIQTVSGRSLVPVKLFWSVNRHVYFDGAVWLVQWIKFSSDPTSHYKIGKHSEIGNLIFPLFVPLHISSRTRWNLFSSVPFHLLSLWAISPTYSESCLQPTLFTASSPLHRNKSGWLRTRFVPYKGREHEGLSPCALHRFTLCIAFSAFHAHLCIYGIFTLLPAPAPLYR